MVAPAALAAPQLSPVATLSPPDAGDFTSTPVAASDDGSAVVLGAPFKRRAYVFTTAPYASPPVTLNAPKGSGAFGTFVVMSGDGSTVAVGSASTKVGVYRRSDAAAAFKRVAVLSVSRGTNGAGGLGISQNGRKIFALGNSFDVFAARGAGYVRKARLPAGRSTMLAVSADGATAALSDGFDVKILRRPAGKGWRKARRQATLSREQHTSLALDLRATTLIVGKGNTGSGQKGSVDVFTRTGTRWRTGQDKTATLTPEKLIVTSGGVADGVGASVAITPDGSEVIAGSAISPRALVFKRPAAGWQDAHEDFEAIIPGEDGPSEVDGSLATGVFATDRFGRGYVFR